MSSLNLDPYHFTLILIALISGVVSPILVQLTKYYISVLKLPKKSTEFKKIIQHEDLITHKLEKIRDIYHLDRVWIIEFHNGVHNFTGKSVQKFSTTYEVVGAGAAREGQVIQNLPTSLFSKFFKTILDQDIFKVVNVNNVNIDNSSLQSFFESRNTKSFLAVGIRNIENLLVGVLCIESMSSVIDFTPDQIHLLKQDASVLAGYLETI